MDEFGRYFKHSPTDLPSKLIRRHLTVASTITDEFTDGHSVGISYTHRQIYRRLFSVGQSQYTDGLKIRRYISSGNLFFLERKFRL